MSIVRNSPTIAEFTICFLILLPWASYGISVVSPYWNITATGSMQMTAIPLQNGVPIEDVIILGGTSTIIESSTDTYSDSEIYRHDLGSGGTWRTETSVITPNSTGEYVSEVLVEKNDLIWEKRFLPTGNAMSIIISLFNDTTNVTRTGGLPVSVSVDRFKITYILSNWTWYNSSVEFVTLDLLSNVLTNATTKGDLYYPLGTRLPLTMTTIHPEKWNFTMSFERWTLLNGDLQFSGKLLPSFSTTDDFATRNIRNVSIIYPISGITSIEYDPTGLFALFDTGHGSEQSSPFKTNTVKPYWIIGVVLGLAAIVALLAVLATKVPCIRDSVFPHRQRAQTRLKSIEEKRASTWMASTTPPGV